MSVPGFSYPHLDSWLAAADMEAARLRSVKFVPKPKYCMRGL